MTLSSSLTIQPTLFAEEADLALGIAPHQAHNYSLLLTTLEAINTT